MKKFRTWLAELINPTDYSNEKCVEVRVSQKNLSVFDDCSALNLVIVAGDDGLIIESRVYNEKTGDWVKNIHMVYGEDLHENLGTKLRDIVFLHSLRR